MLTDTEPYFFTLQSEMSRILRHLPDLDSIYFRCTDEIRKKKNGSLIWWLRQIRDWQDLTTTIF